MSNSVIVGKRNGDEEICLKCGLDRMALREMLIGRNRGDRVTAHTAIENCLSCREALIK